MEELVTHLSDGSEAGRFIALVGASGSGNSSIVRAGLVPRLRSGAVAGSSDWFIATMVPGSGPFADLQAALTSIAVSDPGTPAAVPDELEFGRAGNVLTMASYRELGGVNAAVARRADRVYEQLSGGDREPARRRFLRLITLDETNTASGRRSLRRELVSLATEASDMERVLDLFGDARLLAFDRDPATRAPTVEVAHEALILHWPRLAGWIAGAGEGLRIQGHLADAAEAWDQRGRDPGELYRGLRLAAAVEWAAEYPEALNLLE